jgi:hypothetical protein
LLKDLNKSAQPKVIDFTRYDLPATEPAEMTRKWSLLGDINQKQSRPQDKPVPFDSLSAAGKQLIRKDYKVYVGKDEVDVYLRKK